jgi:hypothetical protein
MVLLTGWHDKKERAPLVPAELFFNLMTVPDFF